MSLQPLQIRMNVVKAACTPTACQTQGQQPPAAPEEANVQANSSSTIALTASTHAGCRAASM